jgi:TatD DNase family protein
MLIDTHAHVNFNAFAEDSEEVIRRALKEKIWMINIGSQLSTSRRAVEFAQKYPEGIYAAVGLHPVHLKEQIVHEEVDPLEEFEFKTRPEIFDYAEYEKLAQDSKVVAIGEVGLDYFHLPEENKESERQKQKDNFIKHLELARDLDKPVMIHCREAHNDVVEILKSFLEIHPNPPLGKEGKSLKGVVHSFGGRWSQAEEYFKLGFLISFNGIITFARDYDKVIKNAPLERLMLETDCPYLTPVPHRGKRNEPSFVKFVAEKIAEVKGVSFEEVAQTTTDNAKKLFRI